MKPIRVCLADDHNLFRKLIKGYLRTFERIAPNIVEAQNGRDLLNKLKKQNVDVVMLDIGMPNLGGEEAASIILRRYPEVKIIVLTIHDQPGKVMQMLSKGVHGYLLKDCEPDEVIRSIEAVVDKDFYQNKLSSLALSFASQAQNPEERLIEELTKREREILLYICEECTTKEIGEKLSISTKTVENHRMNMLQKLRARNTVGLVRYAYQNNLIPTN